MDIEDVIEEKYTNWLNCETDELDLAIEELEEFIKGPCEICKYCEGAYKLNRKNIIQLLNLTKKLQKENQNITQQRDYYKARYNELSKIVDSMTKHIYILGDYACLYEECDDNMDRECEDCIKEYFYKKVKETKDNGSTRNV